ncbi:hypothetical protein DNTS_013452 [Danionella cerebrum]|uniref:GB1/RHD3-type G domain-containing protein n=1 Tax=Danionella cerebrum TaxID=2873325 RepID=A0A553MQ36_9TELE|nr:hypothetical protein DNTS_013452 [Danionella translucida]
MFGFVQMEAPVCLINTLPDGRLFAQPDALQILSQLGKQVVVVSVVGLYRTGKSYLMNRLAGSDKGYTHNLKQLLDTSYDEPTRRETIGSRLITGDSKHDTKIFCLAVLLSSTLVLNTRGTIDNRAIEELQYVTELTEYIKIKSSDPDGDDSEFIKFFPGFVWAVRDFTLEQKISGTALTDDQYLEMALKLKPVVQWLILSQWWCDLCDVVMVALHRGISKAAREFNLPRECIRNYFPSRKCFTFPFPCAPERVRHLDSLDQSEHCPEFLQVTQSFCDFIFEKSEVKRLKDGQTVTGRVLAHLVKIYLDALSKGEVPFLENAVIAMAQIENEAAVKEALEVYQKGMGELKSSFPLELQEISSEHHSLSRMATKAFIKRSFKDTEGIHFKTLEESVNKLFEELMGQNEQASREKCEGILSHLSETMKERMRNGDYSKPGGYSVYSQDLEQIVREYKAYSIKGVMAEDTLEAFLKQKSVQSKAILQADKRLSDQEKKVIEEQECSVLLAQELVCLQKRRDRVEAEMEAQSRSQSERIVQLQEWMEDALKMRMEQDQRAENLRIQEHTALVQSGMSQQAKRLQEQIQALKSSAASSRAQDGAHMRRLLDEMDRNHTENIRALKRQHAHLTESIMRTPPPKNNAGGLFDLVMLGVKLVFGGPATVKKPC